jgi:hypothetical protein
MAVVHIPLAPAAQGADPRHVRILGLGGMSVVFVVLGLVNGFPFDREQVLFWIVVFLFVGTLGSEGGGARILRDWLPFAGFLVLYDLSRGIADDLGTPVHFRPQLRFDEIVFFGEVPTVWLQERLLEPGKVLWWESIVSLVYVSHFIVPFVAAAVLWVKHRSVWLAYVRRFLTLSVAGVLTYVAFPAAPPWLAAERGLIEPIERTTVRGWDVLGLGIAGQILEKGQASVNAVAAVPSLHAAFACLVAVFFWDRWRPSLRPILGLYAVAMVFSLVITGEHYVSDAVLGWLYVFVIHAGWSRWERRRPALVPAAAAVGGRRTGEGPPAPRPSTAGTS